MSRTYYQVTAHCALTKWEPRAQLFSNFLRHQAQILSHCYDASPEKAWLMDDPYILDMCNNRKLPIYTDRSSDIVSKSIYFQISSHINSFQGAHFLEKIGIFTKNKANWASVGTLRVKVGIIKPPLSYLLGHAGWRLGNYILLWQLFSLTRL